MFDEEEFFVGWSAQVKAAKIRGAEELARDIHVPSGVHPNSTAAIAVRGVSASPPRPLERTGGVVFGNKDILSATALICKGDAAKIVRAIRQSGHINVARTVQGHSDGQLGISGSSAGDALGPFKWS